MYGRIKNAISIFHLGVTKQLRLFLATGIFVITFHNTNSLLNLSKQIPIHVTHKHTNIESRYNSSFTTIKISPLENDRIRFFSFCNSHQIRELNISARKLPLLFHHVRAQSFTSLAGRIHYIILNAPVRYLNFISLQVSVTFLNSMKC